MDSPDLTPEQRAMAEMWDRHPAAEFEHGSITHTVEMPWILPGVPPKGRRIELAVTVVVEFEDGKIAGERICWDQASVLAQVGLIDAAFGYASASYMDVAIRSKVASSRLSLATR